MRSGDSEARRGQDGSGVWSRAERAGVAMNSRGAGAGQLFVRPRLIVHAGPPSNATGHSAPASNAASAVRSWSRVERVSMRCEAGVSCCAREVHDGQSMARTWTSGYGARATGRESPRTEHARVLFQARGQVDLRSRGANATTPAATPPKAMSIR